MNKNSRSFIVALVLSASLNLFSEGQPVDDPELFQSIRDHYNGSWDNYGSRGAAHGEALKDGSILIEIKERPAEFFFYNMPNAPLEHIRYVPATDRHGPWFTDYPFNFFNRSSDFLACGFYSRDLKDDPWRDFTCRFRVDKNGNLGSFFDRTEDTSAVPPRGYFQDGFKDFHQDPLDQYIDQAMAHSFRFGTPKEFSFFALIEGSVSRALFDNLLLPEEVKIISINDDETEYYSIKSKKGDYIQCDVHDRCFNDQCQTEYTACVAFFGFDGTPLPIAAFPIP